MTQGAEPVCAPIPGVEPIFWPHMLKAAMATRFCRACGPEMTFEQGMDAAVATWETDWDSDPAPRSFEHAMDAADSEMEHWHD